MFGDSLSVYTKQLGHCFLRQPKCLISIIDVDTHIAVLVLIEYDAVLILLYYVFLYYSFEELHGSYILCWRRVVVTGGYVKD